ncbi:protease, reverse transcriptase and RNase H [Elysia marginata]|uniref:Protease, reverse transcriptase and RNase H n=1 Tax=Elysia marginata TaxID=1093978 RepID=A0AAV4JKF1_9GAST|nr:protease, reverse transcriptase and RNase H [Elysia marginata]
MLDDQKMSQVQEILHEFADVLTSLPGHTTSVVHEIRLNSDQVVRVKPYPLPFAAQEFVKEEVQKLLDLGVIGHSPSPYCSPITIGCTGIRAGHVAVAGLMLLMPFI